MAKLKDAFCSYCGAAFAPGMDYPRTCGGCKETTWRNPIPVAVLMVPAGDGLLTVRRAIEPGAGKLALPGGYVNFGETWQQAAAREVKEETSLPLDPSRIQFHSLHSTPDGHALLIFGETDEKLPRIALWSFAATPEVSELVVMLKPEEMAFPLHTQVASEWFARRGF